MSRYITFLLLVLLLTPALIMAGECGKDCSCDKCADGLTFQGDIRWKAISNGKDFDKDTDMYTYSRVRPRFGAKFKSGDIKAYMQMQYPFFLGWNPDVGGDVNATLHQAYLTVNDLFFDGLSFKVGRFAMAYGDERLIGVYDWDEIGRTFEGVKFGYGMEDMFWANVFFTKLNDPNWPIKKNDLFFGVWGGLPMLNNLNLFYLHNRDASQTPNFDWFTEMSRSTVGIHYWSMYEDMGIATLVDFAYQMGTQYDLAASPFSETTIGAWMAVVSLGYKLPLDFDVWIGGGFDMTSGDDPTTAEDYEGFNNLYYSAHKWRGYMDYFTADEFLNGTNPGLTDIFINAIITPPVADGKCNFELEYHLFSTNQDYDVIDPTTMLPTGATSTSLGSEINIVRTEQLKENLSWALGLGYFMPHEDWKGSDADGAMWLYMTLQAKLDSRVK